MSLVELDFFSVVIKGASVLKIWSSSYRFLVLVVVRLRQIFTDGCR